MDEQLLREFLAEAEELVEILRGDIEALRARRSEGRARRELVARIFRHAHTIKGSAAAADLTATAELAHEFESLLEGVRLGRVAVDDAVLDAFDETAEALAQTLVSAARGETHAVHPMLTERLRRLALPASASQTAREDADITSALPDDIARALSEYEEHRLREAVAEGARLFVITINFDLATFDERFRDLSDTLGAEGELLSTLPGIEASAPDQIGFRILYATEAVMDELSARISAFGSADVTELTAKTAKSTTSATEEASASSVDFAQPQSIAPLSTLVRVELSVLDETVSAAHELLTDTMGALDLSLSTNLARSERTELEIRAARIRRRFRELEERLIEMRMVPVAQTLQRAVRAGAASARAVGKDVEFETSGGEVRLDKSLADAVTDPLLHLLRNAVDHGIEPPEHRAGKPARGRVRVEVLSEGSRVRLRVTDDGRGIDAERIRRAAIERGLIEPERELTRQQSLRLIFRPGFSTASAVSEMSGRGVGLDVVERTVEQFGGELRVESEQGSGTTFELVLPTTMALVPALVVRSAGHRYCIDASHIKEAGFIQPEEIERVGGKMVARWRGALVPLFFMRELLAQTTGDATNGAPVHVVISHVAGESASSVDERTVRSAAVAVEGWDGHHEVLVRGLGRHASRWRGVSGAAELGDGTVALMLDLPRLVEMAL